MGGLLKVTVYNKRKIKVLIVYDPFLLMFFFEFNGG